MVTKEQVLQALESEDEFRPSVFGYKVEDHFIDEVLAWATKNGVENLKRVMEELHAASEPPASNPPQLGFAGNGPSEIAKMDMRYKGTLKD